jgi:hypothetical protein
MKDASAAATAAAIAAVAATACGGNHVIVTHIDALDLGVLIVISLHYLHLRTLVQNFDPLSHLRGVQPMLLGVVLTLGCRACEVNSAIFRRPVIIVCKIGGGNGKLRCLVISSVLASLPQLRGSIDTLAGNS